MSLWIAAPGEEHDLEISQLILPTYIDFKSKKKVDEVATISLSFNISIFSFTVKISIDCVSE